MAIIRAQCGQCGVGCGIRATVGEGGVVAIEGDRQHPANMGGLCARADACAAPTMPDRRLMQPRVNGRTQRWDKAIAFVAQRLSAIVAKHGPGAVALHVGGGLVTEDLYVANKLMKGFLGTAHIHAPGRGRAGAVQHVAFGEDVMPATGEDIDRAALIMIVGIDPDTEHPILMERVRAARRDEGTPVIVLGKGAAGTDADFHFAVGTDAAAEILGGMLLHCRETGCVSADWIDRHVDVPETFWDKLREGRDLWSVARRSGIAVADLRRVYEMWARCGSAVTLYPDDDDALAAAVNNLHVATGRIGRAGAAPFPVPAQAHGMALREVGCHERELAAHRGFTVEDQMQVARFWGARVLAVGPGLDGAGLLDAMADGRIRALWSMGDTQGAAAWLAAARAHAALTIRSTPWGEEAAEGWTVALPAPAWAEKDGTLTGPDRLISRHRRILDLPGGARPDWWAMTKVAQAMGFGDAFHYERAAEVYREHVRLTAYGNDGAWILNLKRHAPISNPAYDELTPWRWGDVPFAEGRFATTDGRARLVPLPDQDRGAAATS